MNQVAERIESLKAGLAGASTTAAIGLIAVSLKTLAVDNVGGLLELSASFGLHAWWLDWMIRLAIAAISGFLFGITYRYVVRDDRNSHLSSGAVLAFGLVRGLAQVEASLNLYELGCNMLESLLMFAVAARLLDFLMQQGWLKQFE